MIGIIIYNGWLQTDTSKDTVNQKKTWQQNDLGEGGLSYPFTSRNEVQIQ